MGSKSTCSRGREEEAFALRYLVSRGYQWIAQNKKYFGIEVDLILRDPDGSLVLVEVKSMPIENFESHRLSKFQRARYQKVISYLSEVEPTFGLLVFVNLASEKIMTHLMFE
ncbi:MAG: YraN family protein [Proteobacteria bacterium]|nr:YraN family protein [Pseudomonadota bacterium]